LKKPRGQQNEASLSVSSERLLGENVQDSAINAVAELVWNSLDADADKIKVNLFENEMGVLEKLTVS
jgi:DNA mismatch repair ATPase MutL